MKKLKAVWQLVRLEHGVMIFIAILIGSIIAQKTLGITGFPPVDKLFNFFYSFISRG